jgi:hypothetical protein
MFKSKWDKWYENQNATTRAWIDSETKKYNEQVIAIAIPSILVGMFIGFIIGLGV